MPKIYSKEFTASALELLVSGMRQKRVCQDLSESTYLPGLTMCKFAALYAGLAKTEAREASNITETARTMPAALRSVTGSDEQVAELAVLAGFGDDLLGQTTATRIRLRGLLTQTLPVLERQ